MKKQSTKAKLTRENKALAAHVSMLSKKSALLQATVANSLSSLASSLGADGSNGASNLTSMMPTLSSNMYAPVTLMWQNLMFMYKTHGLLQTAIDMPVLDALRGGLDITSDQIGSDLGLLEDKIEEDGVLDRIGDSFIWARLFGGGALVVNSEADSESPLGDEVADGGKVELYDACRWELQCDRRIPSDGFYGFYGKKLHESRVMTILGKRAPFLIRAQLSDWGMSEFERMIEDFNIFLRGREVIYSILDEAKLDVYQLEGFAAQLATSNGTQLTTRRIQMMNSIKNFQNALILDAKDKFDQKQLSFGGLAEILKENRIMIASALRMPIAKLFGLGSTGFSSGADDLENYAALVESEVRTPMRPIIRKVLKLYVKNLFGEDMDFDFQFKPLRILSAVDEENIKSGKLNRFMSLYDKMLMNSKELGEAVQKENLVPIALEAEKGLLDDHPQPMLPTMGGSPESAGEEVDEDDKEDKKGGKEKAAPAKEEKPEKPAKIPETSVKAKPAKLT